MKTESILEFASPLRDNMANKKLIESAIFEVIESGKYVLGDFGIDFEKKFASFLNRKFCVGVGSGTDALFLAMKSLSIGLNDEILIPSFTAPATAVAVRQTGASPIFIDIGDSDYYLNYEKLLNQISSKTKAIVYVHLFGGSGDIVKVQKLCKSNNILLIEDCAQAAGGKWNAINLGSFGDAACFSFYPTKNLGALGDGGAIVVDSEGLDNQLRKMRQYGWNNSRECVFDGYLSRLDEIQANILSKKIEFLSDNVSMRNAIASQYDKVIEGFGVSRLGISPSLYHANHLYVIEVRDRLLAQKIAESCGIRLGIHYAKPIHLHKLFANNSYGTSLSNSEIASDRVISLPMFPQMSTEEIDKVCEYLLNLCNKKLITVTRT